MATKKTLIDNWVEERQCKEVDKDSWNQDGTLCTKLHRQGHKGLVSVDALTSPMETNSTTSSSYAVLRPCSVQVVGKREQLLKKQLYELTSAEVEETFAAKPPQMDYTTTTKADFTSEYEPPKQDIVHDLNEDPISYWQDNIHYISGVTQICQTKSPFQRNAAFSTPIEYYLDQPKPHEHM